MGIFMKRSLVFLCNIIWFAMPSLSLMAEDQPVEKVITPPQKKGTFSWQALRSWFQKKQLTPEQERQLAYQQKQEFIRKWLYFWQSSGSTPENIEAVLEQRLRERHGVLFERLQKFGAEKITSQEIEAARSYIHQHGEQLSLEQSLKPSYVSSGSAPSKLGITISDWFIRNVQGLFTPKPFIVNDITTINDAIKYHQSTLAHLQKTLKKLTKPIDIMELKIQRPKLLQDFNILRRELKGALEVAEGHIKKFLPHASSSHSKMAKLGIDNDFTMLKGTEYRLQKALDYYEEVIAYLQKHKNTL
jgi:hypothetical protein